MAKRVLPLSDQIRQAIRDADVTVYRISKSTGIGKSTLSRFLNGQRGLGLKSIDKVAAYLNLSIVRRKRAAARKDGKRG